jgi:hypothetical protein
MQAASLEQTMRLPATSAIALAALLACGESRQAEQSPVTADSATLAAARKAADALGADLVAMLSSEMERGGPAAAIAVCADSAQVRTERHSAEGVLVRRVGTRVRNPANEPDSVERTVLDAFAAAITANRAMPDTAFVSTDAMGRSEVRYMRAIRLQEFCLACHGPVDSIAPAVKAAIAERYPGDQATGYAVGELRGAISVRLPQ